MDNEHRPKNFLCFEQGQEHERYKKIIFDLIWQEKDFIVFLDEEYYVWWDLTNDLEDKITSNIPIRYGIIANRISILETMSDIFMNKKTNF